MKKQRQTSWHIQDWAGNLPFGNMEFFSFDDAEYYLDTFLGDDYEEGRQEYEVTEVD